MQLEPTLLETLEDERKASQAWRRTAIYREARRMAKKKDQINPPHHKNVVAGLEYTEVMEQVLKPRQDLMDELRGLGASDKVLKEVEAQQYIGHLRSHAFKYALRMGKKDPSLQEAEKAEWYQSRLVSFLRRVGL